MLVAYVFSGHRLVPIEHHDPSSLKHALWIDVITPTEQERQWLKDFFEQPLEHPSGLGDLEASARFFEDENGLHIHSFFLEEDRSLGSRNETVAFTIAEGRLFTIRQRHFPIFRLYRRRARVQDLSGTSAYAILLDLMDVKIEYLADVIENIHGILERLSKLILEEQNPKSAEFLKELAKLEDTINKVQIGLMDTQRALNFVMRKERIPSENLEQAREILRDIESILPHNESLFQRINFLLQAALGVIDLEQNRIIKILSFFSIAAIVPSLITGIYGMNFSAMPFLNAPHAPTMVLMIMIISAVVPACVFKRMGWW